MGDFPDFPYNLKETDVYPELNTYIFENGVYLSPNNGDFGGFGSQYEGGYSYIKPTPSFEVQDTSGALNEFLQNPEYAELWSELELGNQTHLMNNNQLEEIQKIFSDNFQIDFEAEAVPQTDADTNQDPQNELIQYDLVPGDSVDQLGENLLEEVLSEAGDAAEPATKVAPTDLTEDDFITLDLDGNEITTDVQTELAETEFDVMDGTTQSDVVVDAATQPDANLLSEIMSDPAYTDIWSEMPQGLLMSVENADTLSELQTVFNDYVPPTDIVGMDDIVQNFMDAAGDVIGDIDIGGIVAQAAENL